MIGNSTLAAARRFIACLAALALAACVQSAPERGTGWAASPGTEGWVSAWASAQQEPEPHNALPAATLDDATLRQLVRVTLGGRAIRVRVSNAFGRAPLTVRGVNVALAADPASSRIVSGSDRAVTFGGQREIVVPAGAEFVSDPVAIDLPALATLAVSMHIANHPSVQTGHPGSRATSYVARGEQLSAAELAAALTTDHWYQLSGVDVVPTLPSASTIAIVGDSITDGYGVRANTNFRWPDFLAERLQASPESRRFAVINLGIGGNRMLRDGLGPNAVARFERDVLARSGVSHVIVLEGVNDLGGLTREAPASAEAHRALVAQVIAGYAQMVAKARERDIRAIGATILPCGGSAYYHPDAANEADRQAINAWIRAPGSFDAVIDFDTAMRDPTRPTHLRADYDSGDGLHPSIDGYRAMAAMVDLSLFRLRRER